MQYFHKDVFMYIYRSKFLPVHIVKLYEGVEVELRLSRTSSLDAGEVNLTHQASLPPGKTTPVYNE